MAQLDITLTYGINILRKEGNMQIKLTERAGRYEYEDLNDGDIFSIGSNGEKEFFVMHIDEGRRLHAVSLNTGKTLLMKGSATVQVYDKEFSD